MQSHFTKPGEDLAGSASEYIDLKIDEVKLKTVKGLSVTLHKLLISILFLSLLSIILMALAFGGVLLLGDIVGSYAVGAFVVAGIFAVIMAVLFLLRNKLFLNGFVKMFMRLFFEEKEDRQ